MADTASLPDLMRLQRDVCKMAGSTVYERLCEVMAVDIEAGGPCADVFAGWSDRDLSSVPALRLLGGVHRLVLEGRAPDLAAAYPSAGGSADVDPTEPFLQTVAENRAELEAWLPEPVQTNEVGRALGLVGGFHEVARSTGLPLRVLEFGCSAGLNLRWDRFFYDAAPAHSWGDPSSPLRFEGGFVGRPPEFVPGLEVAERRGVDPAPVDPTSDEARIRLLSFVWPDQSERFERLDAGIEVARGFPVEIDQADGIEWTREQLAQPVSGVATVLYHSIVMMYLTAEQRQTLADVIAEAGQRASADAPIARLGLELGGEMARVELLQWPGGGERRRLARCSFHGPPVEWLD